MLEVSIKKNQELKDKNYRLVNELLEYKYQPQKSAAKLKDLARSNGRRAFC